MPMMSCYIEATSKAMLELIASSQGPLSDQQTDDSGLVELLAKFQGVERTVESIQNEHGAHYQRINNLMSSQDGSIKTLEDTYKSIEKKVEEGNRAIFNQLNELQRELRQLLSK